MVDVAPARPIGDLDPIMLRDAARLVFADGSVNEKSLRRLRDRGQLDCSRIRGRDYTTLAAMRAMLERTRVPPKARQHVEVAPRAKSEAERKAEGEIALAAALATCRAMTLPGRPRGKQARKAPEPPPKAKPRKRQLGPRMPKAPAIEP